VSGNEKKKCGESPFNDILGIYIHILPYKCNHTIKVTVVIIMD